MTIMQSWGEGKYASTNPDKLKNAAETFSAEGILDGTAAMKNTTGYKKYKSPQGVCDWCEFLETFDFPGFTPTVVGVQGNKVYVRANYNLVNKKTGKKVENSTDLQEWTVADGKVTHVKFYWDDSAKIDATFLN